MMDGGVHNGVAPMIRFSGEGPTRVKFGEEVEMPVGGLPVQRICVLELRTVRFAWAGFLVTVKVGSW